jgi:hypothetical protein
MLVGTDRLLVHIGAGAVAVVLNPQVVLQAITQAQVSEVPVSFQTSQALPHASLREAAAVEPF